MAAYYGPWWTSLGLEWTVGNIAKAFLARLDLADYIFI